MGNLHRDTINIRYRIGLFFSFIILCLILLFILLSTRKIDESDLTKQYPEFDGLVLRYVNESMHNIYIDIGCYNGETVEHFIHFTPDSISYDIITFEPEPANYELCKQRLTQDKYKQYSITILPFAAWIRNEPIFYQINRGRQSRINGNIASANNLDVRQVNAMDFSSLLPRLWKPNRTNIQLKMSMPGAEIPVLEKMIADGTMDCISKFEVEWLDRDNPHLRATRIYIQLMFDNRGFDTLYYTRLQDARKVFEVNGPFKDVTKHYNWRAIEESDSFAHYRQRPEEAEMLKRTFRRKVKF